MFKKGVYIEQIFKIDLPNAIIDLFENNLFALSQKENSWFDISDPKSPQLISNFNLNRADYINSLIGLVGKIGYFKIGYSGVEVIDFQHERESQSLGFIKDIEIGSRTIFHSNRYIITNTKRPRVYQIKSPTEFDIVFQFDDVIVDFIILTNYLCTVSSNEGIKVYDISEPSHPRQIFSLKINVVKFVANSSRLILAEGSDNVIYVFDLGNLPEIKVIAKIDIPGPIATNSLIGKDDYFFVRYMRKIAGDRICAYNLNNIEKPKKIFHHESIGMPLYTANDKLLVFMSIKGWDGVQPISKYTTSLYKIFYVQPSKVTHIGDLELDGIWFSSISVIDNILYVARRDGIYIYEIKPPL